MLNPARLNHTRLAFACLGCLFVARVCAEEIPASTSSGQAAPVHLTDAQNRLIPGKLSLEAENRAHANALYAEAVLMQESTNADLRAVLDKFREVAALDPHFIDAPIKIASLLLQSGQVEPALVQIKTAFAANPTSVTLATMLAYLDHLHGDNDDALRLARDAIARDPNQSTALRVILEIAADRNRLGLDLQKLESQFQARNSGANAATWATLARIYYEVARSSPHPPPPATIYKTRLRLLLQATSRPPASGETLVQLADTYYELGRKTDALKALQQASALDPTDADLFLRCAKVQAELGRKEDELRSYEKAYALNPGLTGMRELLGQLYLEAKRYADAAPLLEEALSDSPRNANLGIALGAAYEGLKQPDKAQACFERIFALPSCPPEAYVNLAIFQLQQENFIGAAQTLTDAETRFPTSAKVRFYQAVQLRYAKKFSAAADALLQARTLAVGQEASLLDPPFYSESALILDLAGQRDRIEDTLREGLSRYPESADLMNELAYFWAEERTHLPEALSLSKRACELSPDSGALIDTRGWIYFQMGETKEALPYLQRAAVLTNNDPVVLQHVGDAYWKLGRKSDALSAWRRGLAADPHNHDLETRITAATAQATNAPTRSAPRP